MEKSAHKIQQHYDADMNEVLILFVAGLWLATVCQGSRILEDPSILIDDNAVAYVRDAGYHGALDPMVPNDAAATVLNLCECERAEGEPNGLGCGPKQGWFVSNFEHQGTWLGGGGLVPLSHAICCRPCLPSTLPPQLSAYIAARDSQRTKGASDPTNIPIPGAADIIDTTFRKLQENPTNSAAPVNIADETTSSDTDAGRTSDQGSLSPSSTSASPSSTSAATAVSTGVLTDPSPPIAPVALVSIGCHGSSGRPGRFFQALMCEPMGASFVTGFSHAERVSAFYPDIFYPLAQVECCTPGVLLPSGEVWPLVRCNCYQSYTKDCGGMDTHALLWGFSQWRVARTNEILPVAPLECCQLCLADIPTAAASCQDLGLCNGAGVCVQGACQCFEGFGGADCALQQGGSGDGLLDEVPWWGLVLIFTGTMMFVYSSMHVGRVVYDALAGREPGATSGRGRGAGGGTADLLTLPLLQSLLESHSGSVGSRDTDDEDEENAGEGSQEEGRDGGEDGGVHGVQGTGRRGRRERARRAIAREASFGELLEGEGRGDEGEADEQGEGHEEGDQQDEEEEEQETEILGAWSPDVTTLLSQQAARDALRAGEEEGRGSIPRIVQAVDLGLLPTATQVVDGQTGITAAGVPGEIAAVAVAAAAAAAAAALAPPAPAGTTSARQEADQEQVHVHVDSSRGSGATAEACVVDGGATAVMACEAGVTGQQQPDSNGQHVCIACMEAPIQVALVPCGHANLCRKCSRRLEHCPICRKLITRRQRLYFGAG